MNKVIFISGLSGSGKSTLARSLISIGSKGIILSTDNLLTHSSNYLWNFETCSLGHKLLQSLFKEAIKRNIEIIIIDNTNLVFSDIKVYVENTPLDYEIEVIEPDTHWRYDTNECHKRNTHNVPLETLSHMLAKKEDRTDIEKKIIECRKNKV